MMLIFYDFMILVKFIMYVCMHVGLCMYEYFYDVYILYLLPTWSNK